MVTLKSLNPAGTPNQAARTLCILSNNMRKRCERFSGESGNISSDYVDNNKYFHNVVY